MHFPRMILLTLLAVSLFQTTDAGAAARRKKAADPRSFAGAVTETFKRVGDVELLIHIFNPPGHSAKHSRAAIVFFFGGGWKGGNPGQFEQQCRYLASRGMVAMSAEYRILGKHGTKANKCVTDGKSAIRWVRANAKRLGVDPRRVAAGGGSAGGHVAACTGVVPDFEEADEDATISAVPDAMVLFNPALMLAPASDGRLPFPEEKMSEFPERTGCDPRLISPAHHVAAKQPPTIIFHGKADPTVAYWTAEAFAQEMRRKGNRCELKGYAEQAHGFFNYGRDENKMFRATMKAADRFLVSLGFLEGGETVDTFLKERD